MQSSRARRASSCFRRSPSSPGTSAAARRRSPASPSRCRSLRSGRPGSGPSSDGPFEFLTAERNEWHRHLSPAGPLGGAWKGLEAGWNGLLQLLAGGDRFPGVDDPTQAAGLNLEALGATILLLALGIVAWRRLGAAYGVFVLASLALPLAAPADNFPLLSMPRFALGVFPAFIALGSVAARPRAVVFVVTAFAVLLGIDLARWVEWQFVS